MRDRAQTDETIALRRHWIGVLSRARAAELESAAAALPLPKYRVVRAPEPGLVMLRGRVGGSGRPFNFGEATVTRCSVALLDGSAKPAIGHAYVLGRNRRRAELAALFDAMLQDEGRRDAVRAAVIQPVAKRIAEERASEGRKTAATKVDFFTMTRGEN